MRIKQVNNVFISADAAGDDPLYGTTDCGRSLQTFDGFASYVSGTFSINALSNENLSFGDVTLVRGIQIVADNSFNLKLNGGIEVFNFVKADTVTGRKVKASMDVSLSAVNVANPDATLALTGTWVAWGDPI